MPEKKIEFNAMEYKCRLATRKPRRKANTERLDCVMCGGVGTMIGARAPNGHFHGVCEKCGARLHV